MAEDEKKPSLFPNKGRGNRLEKFQILWLDFSSLRCYNRNMIKIISREVMGNLEWHDCLEPSERNKRKWL